MCPPHSADPVYNHGEQLRDSHAYQRKQYESRELLGKVFTSWQSRKGVESAPVNSATIDNLKRRARLLHYCTSPLLLQQSLLSVADRQVSGPCSVSAMPAIFSWRHWYCWFSNGRAVLEGERKWHCWDSNLKQFNFADKVTKMAEVLQRASCWTKKNHQSS